MLITALPRDESRIHYSTRVGIKSQHEVKKLISGPGSIFICDECVGLCNEIIADRPLNSKSSSPEELPTERLRERLGPIEETVQGKGNQLQTVVDLLRSRKVSWAQIGAGLGISRQSAWGAVYLSKPVNEASGPG